MADEVSNFERMAQSVTDALRSFFAPEAAIGTESGLATQAKRDVQERKSRIDEEIERQSR